MRRVRQALALILAALTLAGCRAREDPDTVPPEILGTHEVHYTRGRPHPDLLDGVSAVDETDGDVPVEVDTAAVDWDELGTHVIVYKARDNSGNDAQKTVKVNVSGYQGDLMTLETVYALADGILAGILTEDMTDREKAETIYDWICGKVEYVSSPDVVDLMGMRKVPESAYLGLTEGQGNCYTFYAMAEVLLTCAGIPNIPAWLDEPEHYWSLVKIEDEWLHYDITPGRSNPKFRTCLITDNEMLSMFGWRENWTCDPADKEKWEGTD